MVIRLIALAAALLVAGNAIALDDKSATENDKIAALQKQIDELNQKMQYSLSTIEVLKQRLIATEIFSPALFFVSVDPNQNLQGQLGAQCLRHHSFGPIAFSAKAPNQYFILCGNIHPDQFVVPSP